MGLFEKIFRKPRSRYISAADWQTLTAYRPIFTSWNGEIYESELVRAAIHARATHISKLKVEIKGAAKPKLQTILRLRPNEFQTWSQFMYRLSTIYDCTNTAFIVPMLNDYGEIIGIWPVLPQRCEIVAFDGVPYLRYDFANGQTGAVELALCGIMPKFQCKSDFFGENNSALNATMELISMQNQGISEGVKSAATYRFMAQLSNFAKADDLAKERKRFSKENFAADADAGGLLLFPNTYNNIQQISSKPFVVDAAQMRLIQTNVYNYFGVNEDILQNKAFGDKWSAFYEGCVEAFAIQFSEVLTKMLFSPLEISYGTYVMATANRLQYMSNSDKLAVSVQLADRGVLNRDEVREIWNLPPLPNDEGKKYIIRGEYYDASEKLTTNLPPKED